jgi:hypothetical protein
MIDKTIHEILEKIRKLEDDLEEELKKRETKLSYTIKNGKAHFEEHVIKEGKAKITSSLKYLSSLPVLVILTIPFIWAMIIPVVLIDIFVTIYQWICFPVYKIPKVKRSEYVILDRYRLFYLDKVEKINCWYCEYFNGVIAYVREVAARTEQFWCPIKHHTTPQERHSRYHNFFEYGDYLKYREELEKRRSNFEDLEGKESAK